MKFCIGNNFLKYNILYQISLYLFCFNYTEGKRICIVPPSKLPKCDVQLLQQQQQQEPLPSGWPSKWSAVTTTQPAQPQQVIVDNDTPYNWAFFQTGDTVQVKTLYLYILYITKEI